MNKKSSGWQYRTTKTQLYYIYSYLPRQFLNCIYVFTCYEHNVGKQVVNKMA